MIIVPGQRQFQSVFCQGQIAISANLPPMAARGPISGQSTTSPGRVSQIQQTQPFPNLETKVEPVLLMDEFFSWEFLGVGRERGNHNKSFH
ncbi:MAG: hypothetical protein ACN4GG_06345 [Akkermansiaceae bacterium]